MKARIFTISVKQLLDFSLINPPKWAYILHDKDDNVEPHYHFYFEFENARSVPKLAKDLCIAENFIEVVRSKRAILRYLLHSDQNEKHQYSKEEIISNFDITQEIDKKPINYAEIVSLARKYNIDKFIEMCYIYDIPVNLYNLNMLINIWHKINILNRD